jgi:hypothetical protein
MNQAVEDLQNRTTEWLPLLGFSAKYGVSLSTLRRRIKTNSISFKQENGKYFLEDNGAPPLLHDNLPREAQEKNTTVEHAPYQKVDQKVLPPEKQVQERIPSEEPKQKTEAQQTFVEASVLTSANRLVEELKTAYAKILQGKEEQISQLKEEIVDLRMLVRIMEQQAHAVAPRSQNKSSADDIFFGDINIKDL